MTQPAISPKELFNVWWQAFRDLYPEWQLADRESLLFAAFTAARPYWRKIRSAPSNTALLVCYRRSKGEQRIIKAIRFERFQKECGNSEEAEEMAELCEETDIYYFPAGWYEPVDNWEDYTLVKLTDNTPEYWQPLPRFPV